ncbi:heme-binding protein [Roseomonas sp. PWR1]|uniref:Heme-binding protein n=1 Tax=Roseomonas nitratireducens TaxID=2820810 RepID=A0ABS4AU45_9PROT|nr:heme-binding protein [Neoroseomonas nitratireducens]MBP0464291.1 heme-binding protein [Neoroseomonas nitratireducens]
MKRRLLIAALMASAATGAFAQGAPPPYGAPIAIEDARRVVAAALAEATRQSLPMAVAVVDSGGHLVAFERADGTQLGSIRVAQEKARTSVEFRRPTKAFEDGIVGGRNAILGLGVMPIEGGIPLLRDGRVIGAIGVSGGTAPQDGVIAQAGVAALR